MYIPLLFFLNPTFLLLLAKVKQVIDQTNKNVPVNQAIGIGLDSGCAIEIIIKGKS